MDVKFRPRILLLQGRRYVIAPGRDAHRQLGLHLGRCCPADVCLYMRLLMNTLMLQSSMVIQRAYSPYADKVIKF